MEQAGNTTREQAQGTGQGAMGSEQRAAPLTECSTRGQGALGTGHWAVGRGEPVLAPLAAPPTPAGSEQ